MYLPLLALGLVAIALVVAALTFAIVANVSLFQRSAITAPIAAFILSPSLTCVFALLMGSHFLMMGPESGI